MIYILKCMFDPENQEENNIGNTVRFIFLGVVLATVVLALVAVDSL